MQNWWHTHTHIRVVVWHQLILSSEFKFISNRLFKVYSKSVNKSTDIIGCRSNEKLLDNTSNTNCCPNVLRMLREEQVRYTKKFAFAVHHTPKFRSFVNQPNKETTTKKHTRENRPCSERWSIKYLIAFPSNSDSFPY